MVYRCEQLFHFFFNWLQLYVPVNSYGHAGMVNSITTLSSWASLTKQLTSILCTYYTNHFWISRRRRMVGEIISLSISMKVWDWAGIQLGTPGYAIRLVADSAMQLSRSSSTKVNRVATQHPCQNSLTFPWLLTVLFICLFCLIWFFTSHQQSFN